MVRGAQNCIFYSRQPRSHMQSALSIEDSCRLTFALCRMIFLRLDALRIPSLTVPTGLDLLSLDGSHAVRCCNTSVSFKEVRRFLRMARWVYKAREIGVSTDGA